MRGINDAATLNVFSEPVLTFDANRYGFIGTLANHDDLQLNGFIRVLWVDSVTFVAHKPKRVTGNDTRLQSIGVLRLNTVCIEIDGKRDR